MGLAFPDSSWVWLFWYLLFSGGNSQISKGQLRADWEFLTICVYVIRHDFVDKSHYFRNFLLFCVSSCPYKKRDKKLYLYIWENFIVIGRTLEKIPKFAIWKIFMHKNAIKIKWGVKNCVSRIWRGFFGNICSPLLHF